MDLASEHEAGFRPPDCYMLHTDPAEFTDSSVYITCILHLNVQEVAKYAQKVLYNFPPE